MKATTMIGKLVEQIQRNGDTDVRFIDIEGNVRDAVDVGFDDVYDDFIFIRE